MIRRVARTFFALIALCSIGTFAVCAQSGSPPAVPDCGPVANQVLRCPKLGFTYKVPFGWVDRTQDMQGSSAAGSENPAQRDSQAAGARESSGRTLLAAFERPPEAQGTELNSAVIIAIESRTAYPQLKTAADYFGPLAEVAEQRGLKMDNVPYSFAISGKQVTRADFGGGGKSAVRQTSLVLLDKGYILSFTFLSSSEEDIDMLIESLRFTSGSRKVTK